MSTTKKQAANATSQVIEASTHGLDGFDGRAIVRAVSEAFTQASIARDASDAKAAAAFTVCSEAQRVRARNATLDRDAWSNSWRSSVKGILPQLHAAGIEWVEQTSTTLNDGSERIGYRLTSYGQNISSDANQVGQYDIDADEAGSLQAVRKAIKAAKEAEAEAELTDEQRECQEKAVELVAGFKLLQKLLAEAESAEAYDLALSDMADMIEANTPIEVPAEAAEATEVTDDNIDELTELMQATA